MASGGLVEVRVNWPEHPRYLKKKKKVYQKVLIICGVVCRRFSMVPCPSSVSSLAWHRCLLNFGFGNWFLCFGVSYSSGFCLVAKK